MDYDVALIIKSSPKPPTPAKIQKALRSIEKNVLLGWSLPLSKKAACGNDRSELAKAVVKHPSYKHIQEDYMKRIYDKMRWVK